MHMRGREAQNPLNNVRLRGRATKFRNSKTLKGLTYRDLGSGRNRACGGLVQGEQKKRPPVSDNPNRERAFLNQTPQTNHRFREEPGLPILKPIISNRFAFHIVSQPAKNSKFFSFLIQPLRFPRDFRIQIPPRSGDRQKSRNPYLSHQPVSFAIAH